MKLKEMNKKLAFAISEIERFHEYQKDDERVNPKTSYYGYIPFGIYEYSYLVGRIRDIIVKREIPLSQIKFLEVGCGIGVKMTVAQEILGIYPEQLEGIEIDSNMVALSENFTRSKVHNIDAFDFKNYSNFNIIYYYVPIANRELECKLERLIEDNLKVGSFIIAIGKQDTEFRTSKKYIIHYRDRDPEYSGHRQIIEKIAN